MYRLDEHRRPLEKNRIYGFLKSNMDAKKTKNDPGFVTSEHRIGCGTMGQRGTPSTMIYTERLQ